MSTKSLNIKLLTVVKAAIIIVLISAYAQSGYAADNAPAPAIGSPAYTVEKNMIYGYSFGEALPMDVYMPTQPGNGAAVIEVVNGAWISLQYLKPILMAISGNELLKRGYTIFVVTPGSQPDYTLPDIVANLGRAVRFIRYHAADFHIDTNRLGITGGSAGGHLSLMMGTAGGPGDPKAADPVDRVSSSVQAVVSFFPPTDMLNYGGPGKNGFADNGSIVGLRAAVDVLEYDKSAHGFRRLPNDRWIDTIRQMSPIYLATAHTAPTLIFQGDADPVVPIEQAEKFIAKLTSLGVPNKLVVKKGGGHGWTGLVEEDSPILLDWFDKYLLSIPPIPGMATPPASEDFAQGFASEFTADADKGMARAARNFARTRDVTYGTACDLDLTMDVFAPKKHANGAAIVVVDSAGWGSDHSAIPVYYWYFGNAMLKRGYTVFVVVTRSGPKFTMAAAADDVGRAVRYIRYHAADYKIDPNRIGITGASSGAQLALLQATIEGGSRRSDGSTAPNDAGKQWGTDNSGPASTDPVDGVSGRVEAAACFCPPADFLNYGTPGKNAFGSGMIMEGSAAVNFREFDKKTSRLELVSAEKQIDILRDMSPITHVGKDSAPTLIMHGDADKLVPIEQSQKFVDALKAAGVPAELVVKKGAGHTWPGTDKDDEVLADWFDKYLGATKAAGEP